MKKAATRPSRERKDEQENIWFKFPAQVLDTIAVRQS